MQMGPTNSTSNMEGDDLSGGMYLSATDEITVARQSGSATNPMRFDWEVWEYIGPSGGANEFIVRSRDIVTISSGASNTATLTNTPDDIDDCIPIITGIRTSTATDGGDDATAIAWLSGSNTLNVERGGTGGTTVVYVTTVEFTGSNWSVGHCRYSHNSTTVNGTLASDADGTTGSFDVSDWSTACIFYGFSGPTNGQQAIEDTSVVVRNHSSSTTQMTSQIDAGADTTGSEVFAHILKHADMNVTRYTDGSSTGATSDSIDITSAGLTNLEKAAVLYTSNSGGTGTAYGRGWRNARLTSLTNVDYQAHRTGNNPTLHQLEVIDLSGILDEETGEPTGEMELVALPVLRVVAAPKWPGSIEDGVNHIRSYDEIVIHTRCPGIAQEAMLYRHKVDQRTGDVLPAIVDAHNHGWDAVRYSLAPRIKKRPRWGVRA